LGDPGALLRDAIGSARRNFARKALDVFHGRQVLEGEIVEEF
jgi:lipopolysaccharide transport system ATP-binding protein